MRAPFAIIAIFALASLAPPTAFQGPPRALASPLTVRAVSLEADRPSRKDVGALRFIEGWALSSTDPRFGGLSAMHVANGRVRALSDAGWLIDFPVPRGSAAGRVGIAPLPAVPGARARKKNRDSEAMAIAGDATWVAFEDRNAVFGYAERGGVRRALPPAMRGWASNAGAEAMVRLPGGRFLIFSEGGRRADGTTPVLLFRGDPSLRGTPTTALRYRPPEGFRITDAALLPDGGLLLLNRRYRMSEGVSVKLTLAPLPPLKAGAVIAGREIADLRAPLTVDNFEAVAVAANRGRTEVWLASDDNYNPLQRTLLMRFALREIRPRPAASSRSRASAGAP